MVRRRWRRTTEIYKGKGEGRRIKDKGEIFKNDMNALSTILFLIFLDNF